MPTLTTEAPPAPLPAQPCNDDDGPGVSIAEGVNKVAHIQSCEVVSLRKESIDLGLAVAAAVRQPGETFTVEDLAEICECSQQRLKQIQASALRKLRKALERSGIDWQRAMLDLSRDGNEAFAVHLPKLKAPD